MRKHLLFVLLGFLFMLAFRPEFNNENNTYQDLLSHHLNELQSLDLALNELSEEPTQDNYIRCRKHLKSCEALLSYWSSQVYNYKLNGAPLLKAEPKTPNKAVLQPKGFQVLDELFAEEVFDTVQIRSQVGQMQIALRELQVVHSTKRLTSSDLLTASRMELIRIACMGITGFDTPGTSFGLKECQFPLETMRLQITKVKSKANISELQETCLDLIDKSIQMLQEETNFNAFDRFEFLQQCVLPLYKSMTLLQEQSGAEFPEEHSVVPLPVNYRAKSFISNDFLNTTYFSGISVSEHQEEQIQLGELLFQENRLSKTRKMACISCHDPGRGFADGRTTSLAADGVHGLKRNSPGLINAVHSERFFWDMRSKSLFAQMDHVFNSEEEFNNTLLSAAKSIQADTNYTRLFESAYPNQKPAINPYTIKRSIAQYVSSLVAYNSPFDRLINDPSRTPDADVKAGFNLFMGKAQCATCHFPPTYGGLVPPYYQESESEVLGVTRSADFTNPILDIDEGRFDSGIIKDRFAFHKFGFKTPSIRNADLTDPYMHNGAYSSLEQVLEFYNEGGGKGLGIAISNQTLPESKLDLTDREQEQVIKFIRALTDTNVRSDVRNEE